MRKIVLLLLLIIIAHGASAGMGSINFAINEKTRECGTFWAGTTTKSYSLPADWSILRPKQIDGLRSTSSNSGLCNWSIEMMTEESAVADCCSELGYKYVSGNIGVRTLANIVSDNSTLLIIVLPVVIAIPILIWQVFRRRKNSPSNYPQQKP